MRNPDCDSLGTQICRCLLCTALGAERYFRMSKLLTCGLAVASLLIPSMGFPQAGDPTAAPSNPGADRKATQDKDVGDLSLEELGKITVYTASKHAQNVSDAPSSVTIVTADQIQKFGYRNLGDILRSVPGFYVTYDRNYSFLGVRGFGRLGDWNSRVLILIDGHRSNNNTFAQALLGNEFPVDVDLIDRVEVVRGPSSSLYGSNAFFAVINVITRKSTQLKGLELGFEAGSFETYKERISYGRTYRGADVVLSGTFYNSEGQNLFFPEFNSPATNNGIARKADDEAYEHILANISLRGFTLQAMYSSRDKGTPTAFFGTLFNDPRTRNMDDYQYFSLGYEHALGENWSMEARTSYDQHRLTAPLAFAPASASSTGLDVFSSRGNWWTSEARLSRTLWTKHKLTVGSEFIDNLRQDQGDSVSASQSFEQDLGSSWSLGLYAQDEFTVSRKLSFNMGIRHDRYPAGSVTDIVSGQSSVKAVRDSFGSTTNPRLAVIYHPYQKTTLKFLYGSAFRAPDVFETTPDLGAFVEDNLTLKPETIKSVEGVVEQNFGRSLRLSAAIFHNRVRNLISLGPDPNSALFIYSNSEDVRATGTEITFTGTASNGIEGAAGVSFVDGDSGAGSSTLPNSPGEMATIRVSVPLVRKRLFAGLEGQYMGPRDTLSGNHVGAFQVFNLTLFGRSIGRHWDLSASLYNLLNKKYADPGRPEDPEDTIRQDGRSFRIGATFKL
jgi:outer membrane receptor for ferrienterochelin and colicins